jgi:hypothetical protein
VILQIVGNLPRPAALVTNRPESAHARGQAIEQLTVERLVTQLVLDSGGILLGHPVVAGAELAGPRRKIGRRHAIVVQALIHSAHRPLGSIRALHQGLGPVCVRAR